MEIKFGLEFSELSRQELKEIRDYLREKDEHASEKLIKLLTDAAQILELQPFLYPKFRHRKHYRKMPVKGTSYLIYYRVDETNRRVQVIHFWHGARRSPRLQ